MPLQRETRAQASNQSAGAETAWNCDETGITKPVSGMATPEGLEPPTLSSED